MTTRDHGDLALLCEPVARIVWGEPSSETASELRWGTHGSRVVNREKSVWYDHEHGVGGGTLDLVPGATQNDRLQWLRDRGLINNAPGGARKSRNGGATPFTIIATYDYTDESGSLLFQVVRLAPKDFRQRRPNGKDGWSWSLDHTRRVLYRLPEVRDAVASGWLVIIVEGEKDTDNVRKLGFTATCNPGGANNWRAEYTESLRGADVIIIGHNDDSGRAHVAHVASSLQAVARRVRVLDLAKAWPTCPAKGDISDWIEAGGTADELKAMTDALPDAAAPTHNISSAQQSANDWIAGFAKKSQEERTKRAAEKQIAPPPDEKALIEALARKDQAEYDSVRADVAETLGIRVGTLDGKVDALRKKMKAEDDKDDPPHWKVEPWPEPVNGAELLDSIRRVFRRYIVLPKDADIALALWVLHAWTMDAGDISPFMVLVSPTKRCGKTSVLILLFFLTPKSELASNITAAALFRHIEAVRPTLLIDEADTFVKNNEELRGILDSGHTRVAAQIIRNVEANGEHKPRRFSTWAAKAIATIRKLADTLEDRSVRVTLQRKPRDAKVERLRRRDTEEFKSLRSQAARWAADNFDKLVDPDPAVPEVLNDRAADNWRPLLAIADLAGGTWPEDARRAACTLSGEEEDGAVNVELLRDIRVAFGDAEVIRSADLIEKLIADPERPWAEWSHGRPLTQRQLAGLLRPFFIFPDTVHPPGLAQGKGYKKAHFEEAWAAYCSGQNTPPPQPGAFYPYIRTSADEMGTSHDFRSVRGGIPYGSKNGKLSHSHAGLYACTDKTAPENGQGHSDQETAPVVGPVGAVADPGDIPADYRRCLHCNGGGAVNKVALPDRTVWLHRECEESWLKRLEAGATPHDNP